MPICLPLSEKFPDETGIVYVAGWGLHHESTQEKDCTTGDKGPDPFSKCKFPFFSEDAGLTSPFNGCLLTKSPTAKNKGCMALYKRMIKKNATASFLDKYRVNTDIPLVAHLRAIAINPNSDPFFKGNHRVNLCQICSSKCIGLL